MSEQIFQGLLISDFNAQNLAAYLENKTSAPKIRCSVAPFGQVMQALMGIKEKDSGQPPHDFLVVWTQPEAIFQSFRELLSHRPSSLPAILAEVDAFASLILEAGSQARFVFIPNWILPAHRNDFALFELESETGILDILMRMNVRLAEKLRGAKNIFLFNSQKWMETAGARAFDAKLWYMAKVPYANEVFNEAAKEIKASLTGLAGKSRKLIVLDLDGILWKETVGEAGWENLTIGGHDPAGEAYADFQQALKSLTHRGILLGIASKNDPAYALEAIDRHPEMVLRTKDFAGWAINWEDKAQNIMNLAKKLNLGLESIVFIDDSPAERSRVREALPEVLVPEWPADPMLFTKALLSLRDFYVPTLTGEDARRAQSYVDERQRIELHQKVKSYDEWLAALEVRITLEPLNSANKARAAQLLNKTNQMNLTTRRMSEAELETWAGEKNHFVWTVGVSDKFGDYGLTGLMSLEVGPQGARLADFLLSCRVLGKRVEETMLFYLTDFAHKKGIEEILAGFVKTGRNQPCFDFFQKIKASWNEKESTFALRVKPPYAKPDSVAFALSSSAVPEVPVVR